MNLIAAVDRNWGIGLKGKLLVNIPADKKFFRELTVGKVVVMGRKTLEDLPGGLPLRDRTNIVLSRSRDYRVRGAVVVHSIEELHRELAKYPCGDIFVAGGSSVYGQLADECDVAYITKLDYAFEADAYFPNLDAKPEWELVAQSEEQTCFDLEYYFYRYEKKK